MYSTVLDNSRMLIINKYLCYVGLNNLLFVQDGDVDHNSLITGCRISVVIG